MPDFSLYQHGIFRKLQEGHGSIGREEFFFNCIKKQATEVAANCNMHVELSPTRLAEAQDLWVNDLESLIRDKKIAGGAVTPCEFKSSAFLCFWLRRRVIVETMRPIDPTKGITNTDFNQYKNEYLALHIALRLVLYHQYYPPGEDHSDVAELFTQYPFPHELIHEALVMLHHKNVSPHALYLFFKALLTHMPPPRNKTAHIKSV